MRQTRALLVTVFDVKSVTLPVDRIGLPVLPDPLKYTGHIYTKLPQSERFTRHYVIRRGHKPVWLNASLKEHELPRHIRARYLIDPQMFDPL